MSTDTPDPDPTETEPVKTSLRGTLVIVMMMAAFFVLMWFGMFALVLERRG